MSIRPRELILAILLPALAAGCSRAPSPAAAGEPRRHEHHPPHGGTPVVLGDEACHVELVLDAAAGTLQAFVLDAEMENFIRCSAPSIEIVARVDGAPRTLVLGAVANPATGETVGDTSLFEARADWLRATRRFDAVLRSVTVRGTTYTDVRFNFPEGNDTDG